MKLNNIKTVTKKQAKAYTVIALRNLWIAPNDLNIKSVYEEIECVMKLYSPSEAVKLAETILKEGGSAIWKKK